MKKIIRHGEFVLQQLFLQVLQFIVGIYLVRWLPKQEYGLYFLLNTILSVISVVASSGLVATLNHIVAPLLDKPIKCAGVFRSFYHLRKITYILAFTCIFPIILWLLHEAGQPLQRTAILSICLFVSGYYQLNVFIYSQPMLISGGFIKIARITGLITLGGVPLTLLFTWRWPMPETLLLCAATTSACLSYLMKSRVQKLFPLDTALDPIAYQELRKGFFKLLPNSAYYALQGQISTFMLSTFSNVSKVAEIGALSRFGRAYDSLNNYLNTVVGPRFTRCKNRQEWRRVFVKIIGVIFLLGGIAQLGTALASQKLLAILGSDYVGLSKELFWLVIGMNLNLLIGCIVQINTGRGWIDISARYQIPASLIGIIVAWHFSDLRTVIGAIIFGIISRVPTLVVQSFDLRRGYRTLQNL